MKLHEILPGWKTYMMMAGVAVAALAQLLSGDITIGEAINQWLIAGGGAALRAGMKTDAGK
jgi:hypothetical protein